MLLRDRLLAAFAAARLVGTDVMRIVVRTFDRRVFLPSVLGCRGRWYADYTRVVRMPGRRYMPPPDCGPDESRVARLLFAAVQHDDARMLRRALLRYGGDVPQYRYNSTTAHAWTWSTGGRRSSRRTP